jgi:regulator of protease activity HflC (stomatin/prohibitin superfamily)
MKCASRMLDDVDVPPEVARRLREQMEESERRCRDECQSKGEGSDEERIARAEKCVAEQDCDAFMKCMNDVMD